MKNMTNLKKLLSLLVVLAMLLSLLAACTPELEPDDNTTESTTESREESSESSSTEKESEPEESSSTTESKTEESSSTAESKPEESSSTTESKPEESSSTTESKPEESSSTTESKPEESSSTTESKPEESSSTTESKPEESSSEIENEPETVFVKYTFADYEAGEQYAIDEMHILDENLILVTSDAYFTSELRLYSNQNNHSTAIFVSANIINSITVNAGNKNDTLNIYGSNDAENWTVIGTVDVKSSYADYTVNIPSSEYTCIMLESTAAQIRIKSITFGFTVTDMGGGADETYTDFTDDEKQMFIDRFGEVIPFITNQAYAVDKYAFDNESGLNFYTFGNTPEEFEAYIEKFSGYTLIDELTDENGDIYIYYQKNDYYVDLIYYYDGTDTYVIDVYVYILTDPDSKLYTDFTDDEKQMLIDFIGEVIPFVPNNFYELLDMYGTLNFYTMGNTAAEFEAYLDKFSDYTFVEAYDDEFGSGYIYQKGEFFVDLSYYGDDEYGYYIDVYIYFDDIGGGDIGGGDIGGGDIGGGDIDQNVITNAGAGLPEGTDGVYDINFGDATNVKDVTDQGYYIDGCPTVGSPAILVIPVDFSDAQASNLGYSIDTIKNAFMKDGITDYHSVYDYYYISSYGQLTLDVTVLDFWFRPENNSSYYEDATMEISGQYIAIGDQLILDEALAYLDSLGWDLSDYDSDGNGTIDAVVLINSLDVDPDYEFHWAYRYWNLYTDEEDYYYEYDGVSANDYMWASYQFLNEGYDEVTGEAGYTYTDAVNTYTYIHEFGHILGSDDYYDTAGMEDPMGGCDVMDGLPGDHNAYTKFNLGWLTSSRLVTTDSSVTLTLEAFSKNGDTIIIANNYDPTLGVYQEYYIVAYYTMDGLNSDGYGYFSRDGIVVYHVNASLYCEIYNGETYYDVYNNNTSPYDEYGTIDNLIEYVKHIEEESGDEIFTYVAGDTLPSVTDDNGEALGYTFTVDSIDGDTATITFTKAA